MPRKHIVISLLIIVTLVIGIGIGIGSLHSPAEVAEHSQSAPLYENLSSTCIEQIRAGEQSQSGIPPGLQPDEIVVFDEYLEPRNYQVQICAGEQSQSGIPPGLQPDKIVVFDEYFESHVNHARAVD